MQLKLGRLPERICLCKGRIAIGKRLVDILCSSLLEKPMILYEDRDFITAKYRRVL